MRGFGSVFDVNVSYIVNNDFNGCREFLIFSNNSVHVDVKVNVQKQPFRGVLRKRCSENMQQIYMRTPMPKCDFNTSAWVFSCKFAAYFQNTFS